MSAESFKDCLENTDCYIDQLQQNFDNKLKDLGSKFASLAKSINLNFDLHDCYLDKSSNERKLIERWGWKLFKFDSENVEQSQEQYDSVVVYQDGVIARHIHKISKSKEDIYKDEIIKRLFGDCDSIFELEANDSNNSEQIIENIVDAMSRKIST